jgi:hypothetical protein
MKRDGKVYHAKYSNRGGYIYRYTGNEGGFPVYSFENNSVHDFSADDCFGIVPNNEWIEEFNR